MNRRAFTRHTLSSVGAATLLGWTPHPRAAIGRVAPAIDRARLLGNFHGLAEFGRNADGGIDRVAFSDADLEARAYVRDLMERAGLAVSVDVAGNLVGRRSGTESLRPLMIGSHIDSVPGGGNYDGQVGSMGAVEVAWALQVAGTQLRHPLEVVIFPNEEGGKTGSRALSGEVRPFELDIVTASGLSIGEGTRRIGGDPDRLAEAARSPGSVAGFFELHVEQGAVLDRAGLDIGVVEGIVGIRRWNATITGFANHAGTTPMDQRRDALLASAELVRAVRSVVTSQPGTQVGTVGRMEVEPGAPNVIPGRVRLTVEIRDLSMDKIDALFADLETEAARVAADNDTAIALEEFYVSHAAPTAERFRGYVEQTCDALGYRHRRMPSGAGHDAQSIARLGPIGMIFVPSRDGISHSPLEFTTDEGIVRGAEVLLGALLRADEAES